MQEFNINNLSASYRKAINQMRQPYRNAIGKQKIQGHIQPPSYNPPPAVPSLAFKTDLWRK